MPESPPRNIVWLASYPKSGNTWLRFLLETYCYGPAREWGDINRVVLELAWWWDRAKSQPDPDRWLCEESVRAQASYGSRGDFPADVFFKTHLVYSDKHPAIARTRCAVHIVRNPKDILLSGLNFAKLRGRAAEIADRAYAESFIRQGGEMEWINLGYGTWAEHLESWLGCRAFPVLTIRYEDLRRDPSSGLARILEFIGAPVDPGRVASAVDSAGADRLRSLEVEARKTGGFPAAKAEGFYFINRGATNQSLASIDPALDSSFDATFAPAAVAHGY